MTKACRKANSGSGSKKAKRGHVPPRLRRDQVGLVAKYIAEHKHGSGAEQMGFIKTTFSVEMVLRRIAYNLLALFRSVTLRTEENRTMKWRELVDWVYDTFIAITVEQMEGLRDRNPELAFR